MLKVLIISIAIVLGVLALTVFAISKGYAYNHKVDPMPDRHKKTTMMIQTISNE